MSVLSLKVSDPEDFESAFASALDNGAAAMIAVWDPFTKKHQSLIVELAEEFRITTMYETKNYLDAGGLMLYGPSFKDLYRRSALFVDKILKGANPAAFLVEQLSKLELLTNQQAANRIDLSFSEMILVRADQALP